MGKKLGMVSVAWVMINIAWLKNIIAALWFATSANFGPKYENIFFIFYTWSKELIIFHFSYFHQPYKRPHFTRLIWFLTIEPRALLSLIYQYDNWSYCNWALGVVQLDQDNDLPSSNPSSSFTLPTFHYLIMHITNLNRPNSSSIRASKPVLYIKSRSRVENFRKKNSESKFDYVLYMECEKEKKIESIFNDNTLCKSLRTFFKFEK